MWIACPANGGVFPEDLEEAAESLAIKLEFAYNAGDKTEGEVKEE